MAGTTICQYAKHVDERPPETSSDDSGRRRQILDAARRLFSRRGYNGVTVRAIAEEAGLNSAAHLYFYFPSKADLYRETVKEMTAPVQEMSVSESALDRPPERALGSIARAYLRLFDDEDTVDLYRMGLIEAATNPQLGADHLEAGGGMQGLALVERYIERQVELGTLRVSDPRFVAIWFLWQLRSYIIIRELYEPLHKHLPDIDEYVDDIVDIVIHGLAGEAAE
jgi:TetR/AcrR family transcriptional repressor of mexJK operon